MFSVFQTRVPASTPYERNPDAIPLSTLPNIYMHGVSEAAVQLFWDYFDAIGDYQTASPATGTRTPINVVSGAGSVRAVVGPRVPAAGTTTLTITVDGVPYAITVTHPNASRLVWNDCTRLMTLYTTANNSGDMTNLNSRDAANILTASVTGDTRTLQFPPAIRRFIKFDTSLKVDLACSAVDAAALSANCGVIWNLDP